MTFWTAFCRLVVHAHLTNTPEVVDVDSLSGYWRGQDGCSASRGAVCAVASIANGLGAGISAPPG